MRLIFKKWAHNNHNPTPLSLPWCGHWEMPNGHSQQLFIEMIFATVWEWNRARKLQVQFGQRGDPFQKTMIGQQQWCLRRSQSRVVLTPQKHLINWSSQSWFIFFLSWPSTPGIINPAQKLPRNPTTLGCLGCAKASLAARVWSRHVGHKAGRQSFCCQSSWVWGPNIL